MWSQLIRCTGAPPCEFVQKNVGSVIGCGGFAHTTQEPETEDFPRDYEWYLKKVPNDLVTLDSPQVLVLKTSTQYISLKSMFNIQTVSEKFINISLLRWEIMHDQIFPVPKMSSMYQ